MGGREQGVGAWRAHIDWGDNAYAVKKLEGHVKRDRRGAT